MISTLLVRLDLQRVFRIAAGGVALIVAWFAFRPAIEVDGGLPWDKANHALAFLVLTILTGMGWPRLPRVWLFGMMLVGGVVIELAQGLPAIGRDADVLDVAADAVGAVAGLLVLTFQGIRGRAAA